MLFKQNTYVPLSGELPPGQAPGELLIVPCSHPQVFHFGYSKACSIFISMTTQHKNILLPSLSRQVG